MKTIKVNVDGYMEVVQRLLTDYEAIGKDLVDDTLEAHVKYSLCVELVAVRRILERIQKGKKFTDIQLLRCILHLEKFESICACTHEKLSHLAKDEAHTICNSLISINHEARRRLCNLQGLMMSEFQEG